MAPNAGENAPIAPSTVATRARFYYPQTLSLQSSIPPRRQQEAAVLVGLSLTNRQVSKGLPVLVPRPPTTSPGSCSS